MTFVVIGYGSPLRGDDGVGPAVVEALRNLGDSGDFGCGAGLVGGRASVRLKVAHQLLPELAEDVAASDGVVFVDAAAGAAPGEVKVDVLSGLPSERSMASPASEAVPSSVWPRASSHGLSPVEILAYARALSGRAPRAAAVLVGGADFTLGRGLSAEVSAVVPRAAAEVRALLASWAAGDDAGNPARQSGRAEGFAKGGRGI